MIRFTRVLPTVAAVGATAVVWTTGALAMHDQGRGVDRFDAQLNAVPHDHAADGGSNVTGTAKLLR